MATLLLMRHAKSSWEDAHRSDFERPLNARGRKSAPRMGLWLLERQLVPRRILSSSAVRARETAELVADGCDFKGTIEIRDDLYHATIDHLDLALRPLIRSPETILVVGHNPGFEGLLELWTGQWRKMPTAAIACLRASPATAATAALMELVDYQRPKDLASEG